MAIATGTALLIGAGLAAGGKVAGSAIQSRASGRATEAGLEANQEALDYRREQDARAEAAYEEQWRAREADRRLLLQRYGIDVASLPAAPAGPPGDAPQTREEAGRAAFREAGGGMFRGLPAAARALHEFDTRAGGAPGAVPRPTGGVGPGPVRGADRSLAELASGPAGSAGRPQLGAWNDWARMGLGRGVRA